MFLQEEQSLNIVHLNFVSWPDHGVPKVGNINIAIISISTSAHFYNRTFFQPQLIV